MADVRIRVKNIEQVARRIEQMRKGGPVALGRGMREIGEKIMEDVKDARPGKGVPVDTGVLRSTGLVEGPDERGAVTLSFGGAAAPYAVVQHESLDLHHDIGEARYLVRGVERAEAGAALTVALAKIADNAIAQAARG